MQINECTIHGMHRFSWSTVERNTLLVHETSQQSLKGFDKDKSYFKLPYLSSFSWFASFYRELSKL